MGYPFDRNLGDSFDAVGSIQEFTLKYPNMRSMIKISTRFCVVYR